MGGRRGWRSISGGDPRGRGLGGWKDVGGAGGASRVIQSVQCGQGEMNGRGRNGGRPVTCEHRRRAGGRLVAGAESGGGERKAASGGF